MTNIIIGIAGQKQSGKDTIAKILRRLLEPQGFNYHRVAFADELKKEAAKVLGVSLEEIENNKAIYRPFLQWYGTDYKRLYRKNDNCWIDKAREEILSEIKSAPANQNLFVITDVRFPNEVKFCYEFDFVVQRTIFVTKDSNLPVDLHPSENLLCPAGLDYFIYNDGSLEELEAEVAKMLKGWKLL
jgi:hypothetical protein